MGQELRLQGAGGTLPKGSSSGGRLAPARYKSRLAGRPSAAAKRRRRASPVHKPACLADGNISTFSYDLAPTSSGTRITLGHEGSFALPLICANTCLGWEASFARLAELFAAASS
ncbi:MAG TPA: hypothetical protein VK425_06395 [Acidimicrobiales bacterium]|nr:hypothetical protein [Acidimicrobiales bacterium]